MTFPAETSFLMVLEAGSPMSRCRQGQCLVRTPSCLADGGLLAVSHAAERVRISKLSDLFGKDINSPNPNYLPKAPLPNAKSQGGSGFNIGTRAGGALFSPCHLCPSHVQSISLLSQQLTSLASFQQQLSSLTFEVSSTRHLNQYG